MIPLTDKMANWSSSWKSSPYMFDNLSKDLSTRKIRITAITDNRNGNIPNDSIQQNGLLNKVILLWFFCACATYAIALFRTHSLGWHARDTFQLLLLFSGFLITLFRNKLPFSMKVGFLVTVNTLAGLSGLYSFGFAAPSTLFLPVTAVIVSIFCRKSTIVTFLIASMLAFSAIAFFFVSGKIIASPNINALLQNGAHWAAFIVSIFLVISISCIIMLSYRQTVKQLLSEARNRSLELTATNIALAEALDQVKLLQGILPICSHCKRIRLEGGDYEDLNSWVPVELYISRHSGAKFSHGVCPTCIDKHYSDYI